MIIAKSSRLMTALIFIAALAIPAQNSWAKGVQEAEQNERALITDMAGREVSLQLPAGRIVLASSRHLHEFAAVGGKDVLNKIVGWGSDLKLYDADSWSLWEEHFPEISEIPDIGYHYKGTFNIEAVVGLNPDVVIFPLWLVDMEGVEADIDKLEKAGVPVLFIDFYEDPFNHPVQSMELIGKILGNEKRAQDINSYYQEQVNLVSDRLKSFDGEPTSVYVEAGNKGADQYGNTYSSLSGLGALIKEAGGRNIADPVIPKSGPIDPEFLLQADPDIIVISGSYWTSNDQSMRLGYHAEEQSSRELLESFAGRKGWDMLQAVGNQKVYSLFHGFSFRIYNFAGIQAMASWLYPDLFSDIDPSENFRKFHEEFIPVPFQGEWMIGLDG